MPDVLFLPVKPVYAARYLSGEKTAELKKRRIRGLTQETVVLIYSTSPAMQVVALARPYAVSDVIASLTGAVIGPPGYNQTLALSDDEIVSYLLRFGSPQETGFVIVFSSVTPLAEPVPLDAIREAIPGFRVPQSYAWLRGDRADALLRLCGEVPDGSD